MNEYVAPGGVPGLEVCDPCPARSTSPGDRVIMCTCDPGTGRVDEADVSQPCLREYAHVYLIARMKYVWRRKEAVCSCVDIPCHIEVLVFGTDTVY